RKKRRTGRKRKRRRRRLLQCHSRRRPPAVADDEDMDPTQCYENRLKILASLKAAGGNPYPHKFQVSMTITEYIEQYRV
ncbi:unnamed protein product, partial [Musa textilis]